MATQRLAWMLNPEPMRTPASEGSGVGAPSWRPAQRPENLHVLVVGGETSPLWKVSDFNHPVTVSIDKRRAKPPAGFEGAIVHGDEEDRGAYEGLDSGSQAVLVGIRTQRRPFVCSGSRCLPICGCFRPALS